MKIVRRYCITKFWRDKVIQETIILNLQFIATILMSIDYFISEKLKEKIDSYLKLKNWATSKLCRQ